MVLFIYSWNIIKPSNLQSIQHSNVLCVFRDECFVPWLCGDNCEIIPSQTALKVNDRGSHIVVAPLRQSTPVVTLERFPHHVGYSKIEDASIHTHYLAYIIVHKTAHRFTVDIATIQVLRWLGYIQPREITQGDRCGDDRSIASIGIEENYLDINKIHMRCSLDFYAVCVCVCRPTFYKYK